MRSLQFFGHVRIAAWFARYKFSQMCADCGVMRALQCLQPGCTEQYMGFRNVLSSTRGSAAAGRMGGGLGMGGGLALGAGAGLLGGALLGSAFGGGGGHDTTIINNYDQPMVRCAPPSSSTAFLRNCKVFWV